MVPGVPHDISLAIVNAAEGIDEPTRWALAARDGDSAAEAAFVRCTQAEVWRFVASLIDLGSADDLTQETYLRAFRALPQFEGRSSVRTWLLGIANACTSAARNEPICAPLTVTVI
jgi:RNA polymerase sigma-70 factor (ECF subfamily)